MERSVGGLDRTKLARQAAFCAAKVRANQRLDFTAPIDIVSVAEACNCEVRFMSLPSLEGVYSPTPCPVIVVGAERPAGRRCFSCAHELGHHLFRHGMRLEELNAQRYACEKPPEEYLVDVFAGLLLMSSEALKRTLKLRGWHVDDLTPRRVFRLASYFGVGYMTMVNHMRWSLRMIPSSLHERLRKIAPKEMKADFDASPQAEVVIVDFHWQHRAVDLEIGDTLVLPAGCQIDANKCLIPVAAYQNELTFVASATGYSRACHVAQDWAANIRVSSKHYQGLARYRFFRDQ